MNLVRYAIDKLLQHEGKSHTKDPDDRGGESYCGITRKNFPRLKLWELLDQGQPESVLMPHVYKFYEDWYREVGAELISDEKLAVEYFLASVNCGKVAAVKLLQCSLNTLSRDGKDYANIKTDGYFGELTKQSIKALEKKRGLSILRKMFNVWLGMHYVGIWDRDPSQRQYIGWIDRLWSEG